MFDLQCGNGCSGFEAWFRSTSDYEDQQHAKLVTCPYCQSAKVAKAPMAPRVPRKGMDGALARVASLQAELLKDSAWVGDKFADTARAIHAGEIEPQRVHGNATLQQARELVDEGVPVAPLLLPVRPPSQVN